MLSAPSTTSLSNPPFGMDWKKVQKVVGDEHTKLGYVGGFRAGILARQEALAWGAKSSIGFRMTCAASPWRIRLFIAQPQVHAPVRRGVPDEALVQGGPAPIT